MELNGNPSVSRDGNLGAVQFPGPRMEEVEARTVRPHVLYLKPVALIRLAPRLEDRLGVDPFTASEDAMFPVTFGDFVKVYENGAH